MQISSSRIKRIFWASFLSLAIVILPQISHALTVEEVPNSRQINGGWVTDMANIISDNTEAEINRIITELEAKNGTEIAVVTVPETAPSPTPKAFTTELFNYWGIGKKGVNNGVLFLVSVGDRRVEIETGYGIENILPNEEVGNLIETKITPRFKKEDFDGGILAGTQSLVAVLGDREVVSSPKINNILGPGLLWFFGGGIVVAIATYLGRKKKSKASKKATIKTEKIEPEISYEELFTQMFGNFSSSDSSSKKRSRGGKSGGSHDSHGSGGSSGGGDFGGGSSGGDGGGSDW